MLIDVRIVIKISVSYCVFVNIIRIDLISEPQSIFNLFFGEGKYKECGGTRWRSG